MVKIRREKLYPAFLFPFSIFEQAYFRNVKLDIQDSGVEVVRSLLGIVAASCGAYFVFCPVYYLSVVLVGYCQVFVTTSFKIRERATLLFDGL